jgi:3-oxoacyl-[acyl-carrier-protein] synthase III
MRVHGARLAITNGVMFLLVAACFGAVYGLRIAPWRKGRHFWEIGWL